VAGNITGFTIGEKWLEVLKEIAPRLTQVVVLVDPQKCHQDLSRTKGKCNVNGKTEAVEYDPKDEIEKGISAVRWAVGAPTAPYFRFPALRQPQELMDYLGKRNIGIFSADLDPFDFKMRKPEQAKTPAAGPLGSPALDRAQRRRRARRPRGRSSPTTVAIQYGWLQYSTGRVLPCLTVMSCGEIGADASVGFPLPAIFGDIDQATVIAATAVTAITARVMRLRICHLLVDDELRMALAYCP
jgi:hypothetical protein